MLLLLVCVAAFSQLADGKIDTEFNIASCPISFYGKTYNKLSVEEVGDMVYMCFKGKYTNNSNNDCLVVQKFSATTTRLIIRKSGVPLSRYIKQRTATATCFTGFYLDPKTVYIFFISGGAQGVFGFSSGVSGVKTIKFIVDGVMVRTETTSNLRTIKAFDMTYCRYSGGLLSSPSGTCTPDGSSMICNTTPQLSVTPCGSGMRCIGNGQCIAMRTCTVTGSTVIDFFGTVSNVTDRCAYTLMSKKGVQLLAVFQDRRRKDVSLLERVILRVDGADFNLGQGGRVQLNGPALKLNSSIQEFHGVEFSKDQSGVTANLLIFKPLRVSVFFDGYTAQIFMEGDIPKLQGSCLGTAATKSSKFSSPSCDRVHTEPADSRIDCPAMTQHCNLLKQAPFTSCHNDTDPQPYISACIATLCRYPALDGLKCRFHEAYARACSLKSNVTLEGWRSKGRCPPPQVFCPHTFCSAHEFCAEGISGGTTCLCRAVYASKFKSTNTLGEPTVCHQNSASLSLVGCLLEEKGIDYSALQLNDPSCRGRMDNRTHMVTFSFNETNTCGTVVMANNSQIIYKNTIMIPSNTSGVITRHDQFQLDFSCFYSQPDIRSMPFRIRDSSVVQQIVSAAWNYTLTMKAFTDAGRTQPVTSNTGIQLDQKVWVELRTDGLDDKLVAVVTDSCWATNQASANGNPRYDLITKGCANPNDQSVKVMANGLGTSNYFSFNMFQFTGSSADVYLHCKLILCVKTRKDVCAPVCSRPGTNRRRRVAVSPYDDDNSALITMTWTN